jgi:putative PEP-CTERM system histidine kinase
MIAISASAPGLPQGMMATTGYPALVLMSLTGFLAVEQVYRNAQEETRRQLRLLCFAAAGIFGTDLFVYAHTTLVGTPYPFYWDARGYVNAAIAVLVIIAVARKPGLERELYVSRHVMFYTATLLGVGSYLVAMGAVTYIIRALGQEWSVPLDIAFLAAGIGVLAVVLLSAGIRTRFKAFLVKHFYRNKYDYREAWLRLTQSLSRTGDLYESAANGLEGMARIIGSQQGSLWVEKDGERYEWLVSLGNGQHAATHYERGHPLAQFLTSSGWVIDSEEYAQEPDRYGTALGHPDDGLLPRNSLVVPLDRQGYLQGFVILGRPAGLRALNFEDHDILKTAGRQVAAVLAQALVQEKLAETRQFEALNRMSAFLMHDLKNIVAQQDLVLANAQRFRHRPDFIDDAFQTIRGGTERIKKVLEQLATASRTKPAPGRVDVSKVLMEVRSRCADRQPIPEIGMQAQAAWARMDHDELTNVLFHLVRNAQDATPPDGHIRIGLHKDVGEFVITIEDTGCGMDGAFVRDRLFRPFDSTKGAKGMGIGAYQARHIIRLAGGEVDVTSKVGAGTTFTVRLPAIA